MNKRVYLRENGFPETGERGRFSADQKKAIAEAEANGIVFDVPVVAAPKAPRENKNTGPKFEKPDVPYDPAAVRVWANENGYNLAARGKVPYEIIHKYLNTKTVAEVASEIKNPDADYTHVEPFRKGIKYEGYYNGKRFEVSGANACYTHKVGGISPSLDFCPSPDSHEVTMGNFRLMVSPKGR